MADTAQDLYLLFGGGAALMAAREAAELRARNDILRLEDVEVSAYERLRAAGKSHDEAIAWIDLARPLRDTAPKNHALPFRHDSQAT